jgi:hypothetical protein
MPFRLQGQFSSNRFARLRLLVSAFGLKSLALSLLVLAGLRTESRAATPARASSQPPAAAVEMITGRSIASPAMPAKKTAAQSASKRAGKFKLKRLGEPWEVRVVTADGREQVFQGYRERAQKQSSRSGGNSSRAAGEARIRVMRLHVPRPP